MKINFNLRENMDGNSILQLGKTHYEYWTINFSYYEDKQGLYETKNY